MTDIHRIHPPSGMDGGRNPFLGDPQPTGVAPADRDVLALQREQDEAIRRRLVQLGITEKSFVGQLTAAPMLLPKRQITKVRPAETRKMTLGLGALLLVAAGAGLTWRMTGQTAPNSPPSKATVAVLLTAPADAVSAPLAADLASAVAVVGVGANALDDSEYAATEVIEGWRLAWQSRDAEAYLRHYGPNFVPPNGLTRAAWSMARKRNLSSRSSINVGVKDLRVERLDANRIKLAFLQDYTSGAYQENAKLKTMLLERHGKKWFIVGEWQGDASLPKATVSKRPG
jgi:hypothetical protein